ncbi:hypothetical protein DFH08DRAFT_962231 [Mycena albidolilacea]|uniref:Uncharacterized protein n=1 Tax=Mycena albidolilacea TaxID=1033008 RepID=A0AAD7EPP3_9AGAR|nr:hypothetical protein DFH08DRAFT_962231 [Mycena albidolilacea]
MSKLLFVPKLKILLDLERIANEQPLVQKYAVHCTCPAKPKRGAKAKAAAPAAPSLPSPVATLPGSSKTRASKRRVTAKKPPTPESESESESEELPLDELMSIPAGEEVDLDGALPSGTTNKGAALDEDNAGNGNDTPEDRAQSVSPTTVNEDAAADEERNRHSENTLSPPSIITDTGAASEGEHVQSPPHENEHTASPRPESERATSPRSENERTVSLHSENKRTVSPRSENERTMSPRSENEHTVSPRPETERSLPPRPKSPSTAATKSASTSATEERGKSPPPSTTNKGLASGDGVDAGADEEPDRQDDNDDSGSKKDGDEDSNENNDKDSNEDEDEDDNNSDDSSREHNPGGQSYRNRHPGAPVQPPRCPRAEKGKSTAEKNTAVLKGKELKAARKILDEKVGEFEDLLEARAAELSEQFNIPLREAKQQLGHITRYTDGRNYDEFSAKVWKRMKEMNVGKQKGERIQMPEVQKIVQAEGADAWSADDLVQLKKDYLAYQESKNKGTRPSNNSAAKDAGAVASNISKEMDLLQHHTWAWAFGVLAGGHANNTISPMLLSDPANFKFLQEVYKIDPGITAAAATSSDTMPADLTVCRSEVAKMIESDLRNKTNNPNVKMNYKDYERVIQGGLGWTLVGWPEGATFVAPSNFKAGGAGHIVPLWQRLKSGACCFDPTDPALRAKILARPSGKRSRKAKGSIARPKSAEEEPDTAETDANTDPEPAAGKKRKRQEDKGELHEGGSGKKSAGGRKAKQAEGKGKEKEKTKEKKQKGKEDSGRKKRKRGADGEQEEPPEKKKCKPFAHSTGHRSAEFVATDDDEPEGSTAGDNAVAGGSSGTSGSSGVAGGGSGGNAVAGGSTGPGTSSWDRMQEKRAKDLKAAAEAKQRMEADIAADIASDKIKPKTKRKCQPKSAKEIDEDDYDNEDSS